MRRARGMVCEQTQRLLALATRFRRRLSPRPRPLLEGLRVHTRRANGDPNSWHCRRPERRRTGIPPRANHTPRSTSRGTSSLLASGHPSDPSLQEALPDCARKIFGPEVLVRPSRSGPSATMHVRRGWRHPNDDSGDRCESETRDPHRTPATKAFGHRVDFARPITAREEESLGAYRASAAEHERRAGDCKETTVWRTSRSEERRTALHAARAHIRTGSSGSSKSTSASASRCIACSRRSVGRRRPEAR